MGLERVSNSSYLGLIWDRCGTVQQRRQFAELLFSRVTVDGNSRLRGWPRRGLAPREWRFGAIRAFERLVSPTVQVMNSTCQRYSGLDPSATLGPLDCLQFQRTREAMWRQARGVAPG